MKHKEYNVVCFKSFYWMTKHSTIQSFSNFDYWHLFLPEEKTQSLQYSTVFIELTNNVELAPPNSPSNSNIALRNFAQVNCNPSAFGPVLTKITVNKSEGFELLNGISFYRTLSIDKEGEGGFSQKEKY